MWSFAVKCPPEIRKSMELWVGCMAGALQETEYCQKLQAAGFQSIDVEPTRVYQRGRSREYSGGRGSGSAVVGPQIEDKFISAFIRAKKPLAASCCGPTCCN